MYGAWLAPLTIRRLLTKRFLRFTTARYRLEFDQCHCNARRSGRVDGNGMVRCIFAKHLAGCFANTDLVASGYGKLFSALVTLIRRPYATAEYARLLFHAHYPQKFILLAGVGHATLNEGVTAKIHQTNHAIHT